MLKVGSDFSGVGAFDQALIRLGINYETVFSCDMDKYARQTYVENYGEPKYFPDNVCNREIPVESLDLYMTSPPCQAFSLAGKRKGETEERGVLFYNSHEFILKNKPRYFIFENVKGLLSDDNGRTFQRWIDYLSKSINGQPVIFPHEESANYHVYHKVLNSKDYGVPQNRERIFIIGIRDDEDNSFLFPPKEHLSKTLKDVLCYQVDSKYMLTGDKIKYLIRGDLTGWGKNFLSKPIPEVSYCIDSSYWKGHRGAQIISYTRCRESGNVLSRHLKDISNTIHSATGGGGNTDQFVKQNNIRRLTPRECFRLQDFPDTFKMPCSDSQMYKQAGNSITVAVLEKIIKRLKINLPNKPTNGENTRR